MTTRYTKNWQRLRPENVAMAAFYRKQSLKITSTQLNCQIIYASKALPRDIFANHKNRNCISIFFLKKSTRTFCN